MNHQESTNLARSRHAARGLTLLQRVDELESLVATLQLALVLVALIAISGWALWGFK